MRTALVDQPIDVAALIAEVSDDSCGAVSVFVGTVRNLNDGRPVTGIDYSAYRGMAEREMNAILREAHERFGVGRIVVEHRLGTLHIGDASIAVVAAHPHRGPVFDALRYTVEQLKRRVPIWKLEHYLDGTREWVNASGSAKREPRSDEQTAHNDGHGVDALGSVAR
jgi:molybdopterin synthase catalytic subunit